MASPPTAATKTERLALLLVHGVGEQGRFAFLEEVAVNFQRALAHGQRATHVELHTAEGTPRHSPEHGWCDSPITLRWVRPDGRPLELVFREAHWADLDMPGTFGNWLKLVGWSLGAAGVYKFQRSRAGAPEARGLRAPTVPGPLTWLRVRLSLFFVSLTFLFLLATVGVADQVLKRLSWRLPLFTRVLRLIYDYLGDVKLYQDWCLRSDGRVEVEGMKSRLAIRRRMNRALLQTAAEVARGELDGYYLFAHSLGTVVSFNALMEPELSLPHGLSEAEWCALPAALKATRVQALPEWLASGRPPWLDGGAGWEAHAVRERDLIPREALFAGLRGYLTVGSPLDKFATLWPEIVLINQQATAYRVPWVNVADVQDIVGGRINLLTADAASGTIGGLVLNKADNLRWSDQPTAASAHTSYWKAKESDQNRLINRVVAWVEGGAFLPPKPARPAWLSWLYYGVTVVGVAVASIVALAAMLWAFETLITGLGWSNYLSVLLRLIPDGTLCESMAISVPWLLALGIAIVLTCSCMRWVWEWRRFA